MHVTERGVTEARDSLPQLLTDAEAGHWTLIRDRRGDRSVIAEWSRLAELLGAPRAAPAEPLPLSQARARFSQLHKETGETWVSIGRRGQQFALADGSAVSDALTRRYRFTTEVIYEPDGQVTLWVPELALFGHGASYERARADLLEEVDIYLDDWLVELHSAPNHRSREGWVRRLLLLNEGEAQAQALLEG